MKEYNYYVYIITNKKHGTLYVGVTNDLMRRISEHKQKLADGFSKKYGLNMLVYYEHHTSIESAITQEKEIKKWDRDWKIKLIEKDNRNWEDLYLGLF
jgi:putative endonuclease